MILQNLNLGENMIFDFRLRPPYKGFKNLSVFSPVCNDNIPQNHHAIPSEAARKKDMNLFWKEMSEAGIFGGVAMGRMLPNDAGSVPNDDILDMSREYPGKIFPFGSVDITRGVQPTLHELDRIISAGIYGIAMEPAYAMPPRKADANVLYPIYARCESAGIPVVLTISFFQGTLDYSDPVTVQHVAQDFPKLKIIVAHGAYPWIPQIFQLPILHDNVWLLPDIYMLNPTAPGNQMFGDAIKWLDGEHMLYGSAWPCYNLAQGIKDLDRFNMSDEHKEKFFYKNAEKVLGINFV